MALDSDNEVTPEVMLAFYRLLYPFHSLFTWLNQGQIPTKLFTQREFAFTLAGDVYLRYHSFMSAEELKKQVLAFNPTRFEIGPMYSARPKDRKTVRPSAFTPLLRELVFDIDMTDYDAIRTCCSSADICARCWAFIAAAVRVLDTTLREQFGFRHMLWVYSGRRGIHLWISDADALELTDEQRRALVASLTVIEGGKDMHKKVNVRFTKQSPLPPALWGARETLNDRFGELILRNQDCFASQEGWEALLRLVSDGGIAETLREEWTGSKISSIDKWLRLRELAKGSKSLTSAVFEDILLQYTYPRIDAEVSKHRNHLLKAPFCVHPKTGRVCVPVDPSRIDEFDPVKVPTVGQLLRELNEAGEGADWQKTSLKPYVDLFDQHTKGIMNEVRLAKMKASANDVQDW
ncbi:prim-pol domain-containing protein [Coniophora puteana RWD-64-598 SS2]|uniref:DNA primase n=1 Tax=Coniophora puteana (strain RWD-64-598) TaxID=741705 RepID=A0A5M3MHH7_CONPW|nr:prim-pol domain-containing protein [Coniophora puteana RWD-64-598 SS2]EIW78466.1 prim-pol domain-containing protein [Coniophora puteana RWD-64-598 SS2]